MSNEEEHGVSDPADLSDPWSDEAETDDAGDEGPSDPWSGDSADDGANEPSFDVSEDDDDMSDLWFDTEEHVQSSACSACAAAIEAQYYEADGHLVCPSCARALRYGPPSDSRAGRVFRSLAFGGVAAVAGALLWYGVSAVTGYEIGLIAIAVGLGVGFGVRYGNRGMGGRFYQALAMVLTYTAIVSTYVPVLVEEFISGGVEEADEANVDPFALETPVASANDVSGEVAPVEVDETVAFVVALILAIVIAPFMPFLMGFENIIGLALIAFALWEAWRINKAAVKRIDGPFDLGRAPDLPDP